MKPNEKYVALLTLVASVPDSQQQRTLLNAVIDLQESWRQFVKGNLAQQRKLSDQTDDLIGEIGTAIGESYSDVVQAGIDLQLGDDKGDP